MAPKRSTAPSTAAHSSTPASAPVSTSASTPSTKPSSAQSKSSNNPASLRDSQQVFVDLWNNYIDNTPQRAKLTDAFMVFLMLVGAIQFVYCVVAGNYPFNAFLSGFAATVGQFVLTASLRIQTNPANEKDFAAISHERAFADYVFGSMILHFFCVNFIN